MKRNMLILETEFLAFNIELLNLMSQTVLLDYLFEKPKCEVFTSFTVKKEFNHNFFIHKI